MENDPTIAEPPNKTPKEGVDDIPFFSGDEKELLAKIKALNLMRNEEQISCTSNGYSADEGYLYSVDPTKWVWTILGYAIPIELLEVVGLSLDYFAPNRKFGQLRVNVESQAGKLILETPELKVLNELNQTMFLEATGGEVTSSIGEYSFKDFDKYRKMLEDASNTIKV